MKYLVVHKVEKGFRMILQFAEDGFLEKWERQGEWPIEAWRWFYANAPIQHADFLQKWTTRKVLLIEELPHDLSFAAFWDAYNYKVGDKRKAEKLWNELSESEKSLALKTIPAYEFYLKKHPGMGKLHATTFLNQRRYENEFK